MLVAMATAAGRSINKPLERRGPGRRSLYTVWRKVGRSRYAFAHQSAREILRRRRQVAAGQLVCA